MPLFRAAMIMADHPQAAIINILDYFSRDIAGGMDNYSLVYAKNSFYYL
jgi:hypothetical protein